MKIIFACLGLLLTSSVCFANCENAYASAGYGLSHAKKSMEANNFEHQQYYAERALQAFEKAQAQNENCGCPGIADPIHNGIENLKTALSQEKWDNGRFYTKKALANAEQVLNNLDLCSLGQQPEVPEEIAANDALSKSQEQDSMTTLSAEEEWASKLALKEKAEEELQALERSIQKIARIFECDRALQITSEWKGKSETEMRTQDLSTLRSYYMSEVIALHNKTLFALLECSKK